MSKKEIIINTSKLIFFLPVSFVCGYIGGYILSFIPSLLLFIPLLFFPAIDSIREPIQLIFANISAIAISINISLLLKPKFLNLRKFLILWGILTGFIILIYLVLLNSYYSDGNKIRYTIELLSAIGCYSYYFNIYKK